MKGLLGFAVLTGPLWLIVLLLIFGIWLGFKVAKRFTSGAAKVAVGLSVVALVLILPFSDEIAGRIYLSHLCATEAGVKVHRTVELPAAYWDADGKPKFINPRGVLVKGVVGDRFAWYRVDEPYIDSVIKIEKWRWELIDTETQAVLGEKTTYMRHFGWTNRFSPAPNIGESCRDISAQTYGRDALFQKENSEDKDLLLKIFTRQESSR